MDGDDRTGLVTSLCLIRDIIISKRYYDGSVNIYNASARVQNPHGLRPFPAVPFLTSGIGM